MNVLSLFDGMSCGQIALERAGIKVDKYFASEVDKYAIQVTQKNFPDTVQLGDITQLKSADLPQIDLLIGGSPCQGFSFAGKQLNFDDPRSALFFEYVRLLKECKPKYFLLENVAMKQEHNDVISRILGGIYPEYTTQQALFGDSRLEPIQINSALVSAQTRKRLYWTNISNVKQPEDKGIFLKDVIENGIADMVINQGKEAKKENIPKSHCLMARDYKGFGNQEMTGIRIKANTAKGYVDIKEGEGLDLTFPTSKTRRGRLMKNKVNCLTAANYEYGIVQNRCIEVGKADLNGHDVIKRVYSPFGKCPTLTGMGGGNLEKKISTDNLTWRKLTPVECERLQTVPDSYTEGVSNTQRYKMLGNGWTIDVISHIFQGLNNA